MVNHRKIRDAYQIAETVKTIQKYAGAVLFPFTPLFSHSSCASGQYLKCLQELVPKIELIESERQLEEAAEADMDERARIKNRFLKQYQALERKANEPSVSKKSQSTTSSIVSSSR
jgi:hypothetical protein